MESPIESSTRALGLDRRFSSLSKVSFVAYTYALNTRSGPGARTAMEPLGTRTRSRVRPSRETLEGTRTLDALDDSKMSSPTSARTGIVSDKCRDRERGSSDEHLDLGVDV
ncbi:hypothetical protein BE221DRAFT_81394 [Ostreococcus tauri]|uniref:Uncharacterized protein n=1 Tax=Ostreococcus tauri TaxID=70448 RepID=A0A1Y5I0Y8_OSTTA|nr:hypothetical protein BE221DRAFT_81394 [Ostreococcus tauri]